MPVLLLTCPLSRVAESPPPADDESLRLKCGVRRDRNRWSAYSEMTGRTIPKSAIRDGSAIVFNWVSVSGNYGTEALIDRKAYSDSSGFLQTPNMFAIFSAPFKKPSAISSMFSRVIQSSICPS